ncbi:hypothetical protein AB0B45_39700 [Nonomuraea sp. NPDC049152]|uniref:hypothetical protein n=1 Tax=Nonomuraea sp. NPDC049152 TaxID=3154350 RepID=UPI0034022477
MATEILALAGVGAMLAALSGGRLDGAGFTGALHAVCVALACLAAVATLTVIALTRAKSTARRKGAARGKSPVPMKGEVRTKSKESVTDW